MNNIYSVVLRSPFEYNTYIFFISYHSCCQIKIVAFAVVQHEDGCCCVHWTEFARNSPFAIRGECWQTGVTLNLLTFFFFIYLFIRLQKQWFPALPKPFFFALFIGCKKCSWGVVSPFSREATPLCNGPCDPEAVQSITYRGDASGIQHHEDTRGRAVWQEYPHEVRMGNTYV